MFRDPSNGGARARQVALSETPSLATVIDLIMADSRLPLPRKRNIRSSLRLMAKAAGGAPEEIPANIAALRARTTGFHPEHARISRKRWQNAWSETAFALKHLGLTGTGTPLWVPLRRDWQCLLDAMREAGLKNWRLGRLARYCSTRGIVPEAVSDDTLLLYRQAFAEESERDDPERVVRETALLWNKARRLVPGWPATEFTVAVRGKQTSLPLEAFPESFQGDVAAFLSWISDKTPFRKGRPSRPITPKTRRCRYYQIRRLASTLVWSGIPVEAITGLAALVSTEHARLALEFMWRENKEETSSCIHGHATALRAIARYYVPVSAETLAELRDLAAGLDPKQHGLTEKNRCRLRQFDDPRNKALLLHLPRRLQAEAEDRDRPDRRGAMLMQKAVAIELLTICLLRRENVVELDANRHLRWSRVGRAGVCHLAIEASEVKNGKPLEFELPSETANLLQVYLERYQPLLRPARSSWLFPNRTGTAPKNESGFSAQITDCIFSRTGLRVNPHLFRHIGAKLHLDAQPASYEVLRRVFAHRSMATTAEKYCGLEMMAAARHVDAGILEQRKATRPLLMRRSRRRSTKSIKPAETGKKSGR